ncbi:C-Jun-amino-terminal kinase-interacting protein 4-like, partial [Notothenia coriiceps]|uniref:C-Jun-amino-terminal kinase-interacting protein 4-like n=1 Tax=Notothenia coriiceps TaxID=8208 RepID=A0A6I9Q6U5_9TELE
MLVSLPWLSGWLVTPPLLALSLLSCLLLAFCNSATCSFSRLFSSSSSSPTMKKVECQSIMKYNAPGCMVKRSSTFSQFPTEKSKTFDFLNEEKDLCSSPSRKEQKRAQYRQVKAHMQKEDGRVTAHGWSLPSKFKVGHD